MEKAIIYYKPEVENFINNLVFELYTKEYFGFLEAAVVYKDKLIDFIEEHISTFPHHNLYYQQPQRNGAVFVILT